MLTHHSQHPLKCGFGKGFFKKIIHSGICAGLPVFSRHIGSKGDNPGLPG